MRIGGIFDEKGPVAILTDTDSLPAPDVLVDEIVDDLGRSGSNRVRFPEHPVSRVGDLWICGKHRVLCGDALRLEAVARLLGGASPC